MTLSINTYVNEHGAARD